MFYPWLPYFVSIKERKDVDPTIQTDFSTLPVHQRHTADIND